MSGVFHNRNLIRNILIFLFLIAVAFPVFIHLERLPMRIWDESRLAMNAIEMSQNGNYLVTFYEGEPDHWNSKPPMLIWIQSWLINTIGIRELAIRLPSAVAAFFTFLLLLWFSKKYLNHVIPGMIAIAILATTEAYLNYHIARTGDYDSLLTLFMTGMGIMIFLFTETNKTKYIYWFFTFLLLGILTKSIQPLVLLPSIVLFLLFEKKLDSIIKQKTFWIGLFSCLSIITLYYFLREKNDPGYIGHVLINEISGRYVEGVEDHKQPFLFYFEQLINSRMNTWWLFYPCGIIFGLLSTDSGIKKLARFSLLLTIPYLLILSFSKSKLAWYDAPVLPFLALGCSISIYIIYLALKKSDLFENLLTLNITHYVFLILLFTGPYQKLINRNYQPKENWWEEDYYYLSHYLQDIAKGKTVTVANGICYDGHNAHFAFYTEKMKSRGLMMEFKDYKSLKPGDKVLSEQPAIKDYITSHYPHKVNYVTKNVGLFEIE